MLRTHAGLSLQALCSCAPQNLKTYTSQCSAGQICSEGDGEGNTEHSALLLPLGVEPGCPNPEAAAGDARGHLVTTLGTASRYPGPAPPPFLLSPVPPPPSLSHLYNLLGSKGPSIYYGDGMAPQRHQYPFEVFAVLIQAWKSGVSELGLALLQAS